MPSFDIVSEVKMNEVLNAVDNANRELATRFDFRGVEASFELNKEEVKLEADADFQLKQMVEILRGALNAIPRGQAEAAIAVGLVLAVLNARSLDSLTLGLDRHARRNLRRLPLARPLPHGRRAGTAASQPRPAA